MKHSGDIIRCLTILLLLLGLSSPVIAQTNILIVYHSETGNTKSLAEAVAKGAKSIDDVNVKLISVDEAEEDHLLRADAIIVGSPVYNANVTPEISSFIASWPFEGQPLKNKVGAAFVTAGGMSAGEEIVQMNILQSMLIFGMVIAGGPDWTQPFGASAITGEGAYYQENSDDIDKHFLEKGAALGSRVAELAVKLHGK